MRNSLLERLSTVQIFFFSISSSFILLVFFLFFFFRPYLRNGKCKKKLHMKKFFLFFSGYYNVIVCVRMSVCAVLFPWKLHMLHTALAILIVMMTMTVIHDIFLWDCQPTFISKFSRISYHLSSHACIRIYEIFEYLAIQFKRKFWWKMIHTWIVGVAESPIWNLWWACKFRLLYLEIEVWIGYWKCPASFRSNST